MWQATERTVSHHWDTANSFFASVKWTWDDLGKRLVLMVVARLVPTGTIWIVVDDNLCHQRGAKVAFGGFVLDAVASTKGTKNLCFGVNWGSRGKVISRRPSGSANKSGEVALRLEA